MSWAEIEHERRQLVQLLPKVRPLRAAAELAECGELLSSSELQRGSLIRLADAAMAGLDQEPVHCTTLALDACCTLATLGLHVLDGGSLDEPDVTADQFFRATLLGSLRDAVKRLAEQFVPLGAPYGCSYPPSWTPAELRRKFGGPWPL